MISEKLQNLEKQINQLIKVVQVLRKKNQELKLINKKLEKEMLSVQEENSKTQKGKTALLEKRVKKLTEANFKASSALKNIIKAIEKKI